MERLAPQPLLTTAGLVRKYKLAPSDMTQRLTPTSDLFVLAQRRFPKQTLAPSTNIAELMPLFIWANGTEPSFTPLMSPDVYMQVIENAMKAPSIGRLG